MKCEASAEQRARFHANLCRDKSTIHATPFLFCATSLFVQNALACQWCVSPPLICASIICTVFLLFWGSDSAFLLCCHRARWSYCSGFKLKFSAVLLPCTVFLLFWGSDSAFLLCCYRAPWSRGEDLDSAFLLCCHRAPCSCCLGFRFSFSAVLSSCPNPVWCDPVWTRFLIIIPLCA